MSPTNTIRMIFRLLFCLVAFALFGQLNAQTIPDTRTLGKMSMRKAKAKAASNFENGNMTESFAYYQYLSEKRPRNPLYSYRLGRSALSLKDYSTATAAFGKVKDKDDRFPDVNYYYGQSLKNVGDYQTALKYFEKAIEKEEEGSVWYNSIARQISGVSKAVELDMSSKVGRVNNLGSGINTSDDELSPMFLSNNNILYFVQSSDAGTILRRLNADGSVTDVGGAFSTRNARFEGFTASADGSEVFYSRCNANGDECKIFVSQVSADGSLSDGRMLGPGVNKKGTSAKHPEVVTLKGGRSVLYYVSDRPGGYGELDIWYSTLMTNGEWSNAVNLGGRINSDYNEVTPDYSGDKMLHFSSDRPEGIGGFDVYQTQGCQRAWFYMARIMGMPINSHADDYYFRPTDDATGFLTSNRKGGTAGDYDFCCYDLYSYSLNNSGMNIVETRNVESLFFDVIHSLKNLF